MENYIPLEANLEIGVTLKFVKQATPEQQSLAAAAIAGGTEGRDGQATAPQTDCQTDVTRHTESQNNCHTPHRMSHTCQMIADEMCCILPVII